MNCIESKNDQEQLILNKPRPFQIFPVNNNEPVYCLQFHKGFLLAGVTGQIKVMSWSPTKCQIIQCVRTIPISLSNDQPLEQTVEINCMIVDKENDLVYVGCGNNLIHQINLEEGKKVCNLKGHTDYIHDLADYENKIYSGGEDGLVLLWDTRTCESIGQLEPHKNNELTRKEFGKWIGAVVANDDWLVCGGGPKASLWHLRSMQSTTIFEYPSKIHVTGFVDEQIYLGGDSGYLNQYIFNGNLKAEIPVSAASVYSVIFDKEPNYFMAIGGSSNYLDICSNINYRDFVLKLYEKES